MKLLKDDAAYHVLSRYDLDIDHWLLVDDSPYRGKASHKNAVLYAIRQYGSAVICDEGKMLAKEISANEFFSEPSMQCDEIRDGVAACVYKKTNDKNMGDNIKYWYAFLEPPYPNGYSMKDFRDFNAAIFPQGTDCLEIFSWSTDWSDFFDAGHEWWGAACWSIYDRLTDRYVVIFASCTD